MSTVLERGQATVVAGAGTRVQSRVRRPRVSWGTVLVHALLFPQPSNTVALNVSCEMPTGTTNGTL